MSKKRERNDSLDQYIDNIVYYVPKKQRNRLSRLMNSSESRRLARRGGIPRGRNIGNLDKKKELFQPFAFAECKVWLIGRRVKAPWLHPDDKGKYEGLLFGAVIERVHLRNGTAKLRFDDGFIFDSQPLSSIVLDFQSDESMKSSSFGEIAWNSDVTTANILPNKSFRRCRLIRD